MEIICLNKVIDVTSEIYGHEAENLIGLEKGIDKGWLCQEGIKKGSVTFQMKKPVILTSIKVQNNNSSMVEILVGNSNDSKNEFSSFVPVSVFMTPEECNDGTNQNLLKIFQEKDLKEEARKNAWDRLKVVCRQPYNKKIPFGLKLLEVQGREDENMSRLENEKKNEITIGSFFKKALLKKKNPEASISDVGEVKLSLKPEVDEKETQPVAEKPKKKKLEIKAKSSTKVKRKLKDNSEKKMSEKSDAKHRKKIKRKPFKKLMEDVVFVISGFKNPLRGEIRNFGLEMGAKYSPDWDSRCTHLICAYENTPKFNQVKGKGKIVRKEWLEKCHSDRKRYPWRKFALAKNDLKEPESEEEIEELCEDSEHSEEERLSSKSLDETSVVISASSSTAETTASDSLKSPKKQSKLREEKIASPQSLQKKENLMDVDEYDVPTDEEEADTEREDTTDYPLPLLKNILTSKIIFINPKLTIKSTIERYVVAFNGIVVDQFNKDIDYYITHSRGDIPDATFNVTCVKPSWILDIISEEKFVDPAEHLA